jgi:hypothetical protein
VVAAAATVEAPTRPKNERRLRGLGAVMVARSCGQYIVLLHCDE